MQEMTNLEKGHRLSRRILKWEQALAALAMTLLCVLSFANVLVRYFSHISFAFTEEISIFLLVFLTLVGASSAFATRKQIEITLVIDLLPSSVQNIAQKLVSLANLLMFGLLLWFGIIFAWDDYRFDVTSSSLGIPQWWYSIWLPLLSLLILIRLALSIWLAHIDSRTPEK
jgi:TRAP-type C4-dicarboxylate transport system permease small subunit